MDLICMYTYKPVCLWYDSEWNIPTNDSIMNQSMYVSEYETYIRSVIVLVVVADMKQLVRKL